MYVKSNQTINAISKKMQTLIGMLFLLRLAYAVFHAKSPVLYTRLGTTSDVLEITTTGLAMLASFMEDQRTIHPSDILVLYFSALTILSIPRLRSLWYIPSSASCKGLFTAIYILLVLSLLLETKGKTNMLHILHQDASVEQVVGFWNRSLFIWVNPFLRAGYSTTLSLGDIPRLDENLEGEFARRKLQKAWKRSRAKHRLLKAVLRAYRSAAFSAVVPRLALSGFTFCQPFLITSTIKYFQEGLTIGNKEYGQALIGSYLLVYLGMAVRIFARNTT